MSIDIEELERLAKASLNGRWYDGNPDPKTILKLINRLREAEKERDELKAWIGGGVRVYAFNEERRYEAMELVDERNLKQNATLIIDYGVEI
jgi:hypothetical protein